MPIIETDRPRIEDSRTEDRTRYEEQQERRPITDLFRDLRDDTMRLIRQEFALARSEMSEKTSRIGRNIAYIGVGAALLFGGLILLLLAATWLLAVGLAEAGIGPAITSWLSPLIVGVFVCIVGYALVHKAISTIKHESAVPKKTLESLQEDQQWLTEKMR